tara:strand:- start:2 stop:580 length:579 start_codon:yes stop_codon:yes gene_type:complete
MNPYLENFPSPLKFQLGVILKDVVDPGSKIRNTGGFYISVMKSDRKLFPFHKTSGCFPGKAPEVAADFLKAFGILGNIPFVDASFWRSFFQAMVSDKPDREGDSRAEFPYRAAADDRNAGCFGESVYRFFGFPWKTGFFRSGRDGGKSSIKVEKKGGSIRFCQTVSDPDMTFFQMRDHREALPISERIFRAQ